MTVGERDKSMTSFWENCREGETAQGYYKGYQVVCGKLGIVFLWLSW